MLVDVVRDRLQQVRLPQPGAAVDEQRVVRLRRRFGDRECGRVREAVRRADHEEVERVLRVDVCELALGALRRLGRGGARTGRQRVGNGQADPPLDARRVADGGLDQADEMALDPLAREVVRDGDRERVVRQVEALGLSEPRAVRGLIECPLEPTGDFVPQGLRSQLNLALHAGSLAPLQLEGAPNIPASRTRDNVDYGRVRNHDLQGFSNVHIPLHTCGNRLVNEAFSRRLRGLRLWTTEPA